jgi:transcriptional regulator with XRE-family HTH domain
MSEKKIGEFIATKRKEKGLTQQELGEKLFVTDKAVSKWERGISFPDITLLKKLASVLEVDIEDILEGENKSKKKSIESKIEEIRNQINKKNQKRRNQLIIGIVALFVVLVIVIFKNISFGYSIKTVHYSHTNRDIKLGIPRGSFFIKNNDRSYSIRNLRSANIIENETKRYLKTLKYSNCNDTIYYYDEDSNFSIINYNIKGNVLYSTLSYEIVENDYCVIKKLEEYGEKLGYLKGFHTLNGGKIDFNRTGNYLEVLFQDGYVDYSNEEEYLSEIYSFKAEMKVLYYKNIETLKETKNADMTVIEDSIGRFEIVDDKLYYYREKIIETKLKLPEVSVFKLKDGKMYLIENYLSDYEDEIVLK